MYQKIFCGMFVLILLSGCALIGNQQEINQNQAKINAYLIDNTNIDKLNDCTHLDSCNAYKCLCDTMVSENDYCQRYEDYCVNNVCEEITRNVNEVNFMDDIWDSIKYSGCFFVYDMAIMIHNHKINEFTDEELNCLSIYRKNNIHLNQGDFQFYTYRGGIFFNEEGMIIEC